MNFRLGSSIRATSLSVALLTVMCYPIQIQFINQLINQSINQSNFSCASSNPIVYNLGQKLWTDRRFHTSVSGYPPAPLLSMQDFHQDVGSQLALLTF